MLRPWTLDDSDDHPDPARRRDRPLVRLPRRRAAGRRAPGLDRAHAHRVGRPVQGHLPRSSGAGEPPAPSTSACRTPGVGVLSWAVFAPYRGQGLAWRAVRLLVEWAFEALDLERVEAHVNPDNRASVRTALRAGPAPRGPPARQRHPRRRAPGHPRARAAPRRRPPGHPRGLHRDARLDPADQARHRPGRAALACGRAAALRARLQARVGPARRRRRPARVPRRLRRPRGPRGARPRACTRRSAARRQLAPRPARLGRRDGLRLRPRHRRRRRRRAGAPAAARDPRRPLDRAGDWPGRVAPYNERLLTALHAHDGRARSTSRTARRPRDRATTGIRPRRGTRSAGQEKNGSGRCQIGSSATPTKRIVRYVIEKWNRRIGLQDVLGRTGPAPSRAAGAPR